MAWALLLVPLVALLCISVAVVVWFSVTLYRQHERPVRTSFPSITPHDLRHSAASLAISAGANVKAVQRMLGHAKASMTLDVYADLFDADLDDVAANLDAAIRSAAYPLRTGGSETAPSANP